jgi:hypothetical protein
MVYPDYRPPVPFSEMASEDCPDNSCEVSDTVCEIKEHKD